MRVGHAVTKEIGNLSTNKGGSEAWKASGIGDPLSQEEYQFLERAVERLILRVAEYHSGASSLPQVSIRDINA